MQEEVKCVCHICNIDILQTESSVEPECKHKVHTKCMFGSFVENGFYARCGVCNAEFIEEEILDRHVEARRQRDRNEQKEAHDKCAELEKTDTLFAKNIKNLKLNIRKFGGSYNKILRELNKLKKEYNTEVEPFIQSILIIRNKYKTLANQIPLWKDWSVYKRKITNTLGNMTIQYPAVDRIMILKYINKYKYCISNYKYKKHYMLYRLFRNRIL
jgi:hypothetical protein